MPFPDGAFDVVFSNSVVEHVPRENWLTFAREIRRVGDRYFVQTPNKWFPLEPHYMLPLVQFLPRRLRHRLDECFAGGKIDLLDERTLRRLFPDAEIRRERMLGLTKSLMAVRVVHAELPSAELPSRAGSAARKSPPPHQRRGCPKSRHSASPAQGGETSTGAELPLLPTQH